MLAKIRGSKSLAKTDGWSAILRERGWHVILCYVDIMSTKNYKTVRLSKEEARKLIKEVAGSGRVVFTSHATRRLRERELILNDVMNVLLSKSMKVSEGEPHAAGYTYRCFTKRITVVVCFTLRGDGVVVITVFMTERRD